MTQREHPERPPTRRAPLGEATRRVNNSQASHPRLQLKRPSMPHHESLKPQGQLQTLSSSPISPLSALSNGEYYPAGDSQPLSSPITNATNARVSQISKEGDSNASHRISQVSTTSTNASDGRKIKSLIGPWKLGKTLGKGATARVRLARHVYTGQQAAIKIVQKRNAQLSQAGSLNALDQALQADIIPDPSERMRQMPIGIEREVAIMKLIQHPHIMKLYDIWENRSEIYIVLEFVENGELFEHIAHNGRLQEEEAMKYFRQILSAVGYCHGFNICHRDLKPENILLTKDLEIKIADFGMAALHQSPDHKLKTSCGSPHYAAPELIKGAKYRGDKADIWSMGVILFAALSGHLPFDVEGSGQAAVTALLHKIKVGSYEMSAHFSLEAQNLIWRIFHVNPNERINLAQIWRHPLVRRYDYLDNLGGGMDPMTPNLQFCGTPILRRSEVSKDLLRQLRSLWHLLSEEQLIDALMSPKPNDQKMFYALLKRYMDAELENYTPDIGYSTSDYHHIRPRALTKTYSTRQFHQLKANGHGRQMSRFTVISNGGDTEQSYDPFKASRPQHLDKFRTEETVKVTIHRTRPSDEVNNVKVTSKPWAGSVASVAGSDRSRNRKPFVPRGYASRSSLASSTKSRGSNPYVRASVGRKRGVSFTHLRQQSLERKQSTGLVALRKHHSSNTEVTDDDGHTLRPVDELPASTRYIRSKKAQAAISSQPLLSVPQPGRASQLWTEDVRQLSSSLAQDCDDAFNKSCAESEPDGFSRHSTALTSLHQSQDLLSSHKPGVLHKSKPLPPDNRPLPPPPPRTDSVKAELIEAKRQAELRKKSGGDDSPGYLDRMVSHLDRLIQPISPSSSNPDRRISSAPMSTRPLPSIYEAGREEDTVANDARHCTNKERQKQAETKNGRIASAPEARSSRNNTKDRFSRPHTNVRDTIRVVQPESPVKAPAPLTIRKKSSQLGQSPPVVVPAENDNYASQNPKSNQPRPGLRQQYTSGSRYDATADLARIDEDQNDEYGNDSNSGTIVKKKSSWFKRSSKSGSELEWRMSTGGTQYVASQSSGSGPVMAQKQDEPAPVPSKKKFSLGRLFKKRSSRTEMTVTANDDLDDSASIEDSMVEARRQVQSRRASNTSDYKARQIEPQRNWIAKLFHVKPVSGFICFSISKRRARQEITNLLREWKQYGIRDVQVDKDRNIVFGRVAAKNFLDLKEVSFAGEIMTVIEHSNRKRSHLSIAKFTQERGAASSFHKVIETLETVLKVRNLLVADEQRKQMMIKTLKSGF